MSLIAPADLPPDPSIKRIQFTSRADNSIQVADLYLPARYTTQKIPLILAPDPITWTAEEDYHGGLKGLFRGYHPGWYGLADL